MIEAQNILIIRTDRIGDVVLTLPMAVEIKKVLPSSKITFLAREYTELFPQMCTAVDETLSLPSDDGSGLAALLKEHAFDTVFVVSPDFRIAKACLQAGIRNRVGTAYRWYSPFLFNRRIHDHRKSVLFHELEYNLRMLRPLGIAHQISPHNIDYKLAVPAEYVSCAEERLREAGAAGKKIVVLHPGSGGSSVDLPAAKFRELTGKLCGIKEVSVVLTGSGDERGLCEEAGRGLPVLDFSGQLLLKELVGMIKKSDIFVSNSTGPLHIAASLGIHTIGFYPRLTVCSAKRWGPYAANAKVFEPAPGCEDCGRGHCKKSECMQTINIAEVFEHCEKILVP